MPASVDKIARLRVFKDGREMNLDVVEISGNLLVISRLRFTATAGRGGAVRPCRRAERRACCTVLWAPHAARA
jgi:D-Tyr-tRNAtyr deacylase